MAIIQQKSGLGNMDQKGNSIADYRNNLDKTLANPDLMNDEILRILVKNQLSGCNELLVERRSNEVSHFLNMLRSASYDNLERSKSRDGSHRAWKVKQDTEDCRVMYREEGARFHTLLVEGYVDGPVDVCMCISCESSLYKQWWPQLTIPTFKVLSSECLQKIRTGEQISVVRMKLPWPLSTREALIHYFAFEYFQDDLMVVLLNSISDSENLDQNTHGFTRDAIPEAEDVVRIDVVGGFALQKVTENRSYFRTIGNMDLKLDFVPTALINFISRQVVGSGFMLYKKEVAAVSKGDGKFLEALKDPVYVRIREALYPAISNTPTRSRFHGLEEQSHIDKTDYEGEIRGDYSTNEIEEIEEKGNEESEFSEAQLSSEATENKRVDDDEVDIGTSLKNIENGYKTKTKKKVSVRPEVRRAMETLDNAISTFRERNKNPETFNSVVNDGNNSTSIEYDDVGTSLTKGKELNSPNMASSEPRTSSPVLASREKEYNVGETKQSKITPVSVSPDQDTRSDTNYTSLECLMNVNKETNLSFVEKLPANDANSNNSGTVETRRIRNKRSTRFRCLPFGS